MRSLTVTLPDDLVQAIEAKVAAGEYASESEVVQDGLASLLEFDQELEAWLRDEVVPRCRNRQPIRPPSFLPRRSSIGCSVASPPSISDNLSGPVHDRSRN